MSPIGIFFFFAFSGNVAFRYGFGIVPPYVKKEPKVHNKGIIISIALSTLLLAIIRSLIDPLRLAFLLPLLYLFVVGGVFFLIWNFLPSIIGGKKGEFAQTIFYRFILNSLLFGAPVLVTEFSFDIVSIIVGGVASGFGYWLAVTALDAIDRKLSFEPIPAAMKGTPIYFVSAGLMALAFFGFDRIILQDLVRL
jgi:Na+-transporting NADH:ubiquinone oxidoreductase subunit NqrE